MIQIDMPMPKNCLDCPACNEYLMCAIPVNGRKWGENDVREFGQGRPEWCPLKEQEAVKPKSKVRHGANAQGRYIGFDPPIWTPMEISFKLKEPLTDAQIDALFPLDQLGDDPRWVETINKMKETNRRARGDA